jgi:adenosine deaminase
VSNEWRLIEEHFNLKREELFGLARKGIDVVFGGEEEQKRLREIMW